MENHSEKIQDYIEGHLEGEELIQFEARLLIDDELRIMLALQQEVYDILNKRMLSKEMELRGTLSDVSNNFRFDPKAKVINLKRIISIVAAACVLIVGSIFLMNINDSDLYDLPVLHSEIVRGHEENVSYENVVKAFNNKEYTAARTQLETLLASNPDQVQYAYYLGLTYFGDRNWETAITKLRPIASGESVFADEAKYYLAIAYYKNGDKMQANNLLKQLESKDELGKKAQKLFDEIN